MSKINVVDMAGKVVSEIELNDAVFGIEDHTGVPTEGDYLAYQLGSYGGRFSYKYDTAGNYLIPLSEPGSPLLWMFLNFWKPIPLLNVEMSSIERVCPSSQKSSRWSAASNI